MHFWTICPELPWQFRDIPQSASAKLYHSICREGTPVPGQRICVFPTKRTIHISAFLQSFFCPPPYSTVSGWKKGHFRPLVKPVHGDRSRGEVVRGNKRKKGAAPKNRSRVCIFNSKKRMRTSITQCLRKNIRAWYARKNQRPRSQERWYQYFFVSGCPSLFPFRSKEQP